MGRTPGLPRAAGDLGIGKNTTFPPASVSAQGGAARYPPLSIRRATSSGSKAERRLSRNSLIFLPGGGELGPPDTSIPMKKFGDSIRFRVSYTTFIIRF